MERQPPLNKGLSAEKVHAALVEADGSPTQAARILGVTRNTVVYWMKQAKIERNVVIVKESQ